MTDDNREIDLNELNDVNGGLGVLKKEACVYGSAGFAPAPALDARPLVAEAAIPLKAAAAPLTEAAKPFVEATRPLLPFTTLEEANTYARNAGMNLFTTLEAANSWINTGGRATLL